MVIALSLFWRRPLGVFILRSLFITWRAAHECSLASLLLGLFPLPFPILLLSVHCWYTSSHKTCLCEYFRQCWTILAAVSEVICLFNLWKRVSFYFLVVLCKASLGVFVCQTSLPKTETMKKSQTYNMVLLKACFAHIIFLKI